MSLIVRNAFPGHHGSEGAMPYRVEHDRKWYKSLRGAQTRAVEVRGGDEVTVTVVDEQGAVVWTTDALPKITVRSDRTEHVTPRDFT
jgi:hypothetical protein